MDPRGGLREAVGEHCSDAALRERLLDCLSRPGYALHPDSACRAANLVLAVCRATGDVVDPVARRAAAAVELMMNAAYLLDDLADGDASSTRGSEIALASAMLMCGGATATRAAVEARSGATGALLALYDSAVQACAGQLLDAEFESRDAVSTDEALRMTCLKSGSIGKLAAGFAARMASDDARIVTDAEDFGFNLFSYAQLIDDLRDATTPCGDLARRKKTVPLAFLARADRAPGGASAGAVDDRVDGRIDGGREPYAWYTGSGAELFGAVVAEALLNRAKAAVRRLRQLRCPVADLERIVDSMEADTADAFGRCFRRRS